jgi:hypothetical protein
MQRFRDYYPPVSVLRRNGAERDYERIERF